MKIDNLNIFTIGGMIGVGKTTLIENIYKILSSQKKANGDFYKVGVVYELGEKVESNIFNGPTNYDTMIEDILLPSYYLIREYLDSDEPAKYLEAQNNVFILQNMFLSNRHSKILAAIDKAKKENYDYLLIDRTIYEDLIFTEQNLKFNQQKFKKYFRGWEDVEYSLRLELEKHNYLHLILSASAPTIISRIVTRGRDYENPRLEIKQLEEKLLETVDEREKDVINNRIKELIEQEESLHKYYNELTSEYLSKMISNFHMTRERKYEQIDTDNITSEELAKKIISEHFNLEK